MTDEQKARQYTWEEWDAIQQALDDEGPFDNVPYVAELLTIKPELFLWVEYEASGDSDEPDATYIQLSHVIMVLSDKPERFLKLRLSDGSSLTTSDPATIQRFWDQWEVLK